MSAGLGEGVPELIRELEARLSAHISDDKLTVERHLRQARQCRAHLSSALTAISSGFPLDTAAIDLHAALSSLSEITTQNPTETLLDEIFSTFCVGK
jgi:tRNA modification GTPase